MPLGGQDARPHRRRDADATHPAGRRRHGAKGETPSQDADSTGLGAGLWLYFSAQDFFHSVHIFFRIHAHGVEWRFGDVDGNTILQKT